MRNPGTWHNCYLANLYSFICFLKWKHHTRLKSFAVGLAPLVLIGVELPLISHSIFITPIILCYFKEGGIDMPFFHSDGIFFYKLRFVTTKGNTGRDTLADTRMG